MIVWATGVTATCDCCTDLSGMSGTTTTAREQPPSGGASTTSCTASVPLPWVTTFPSQGWVTGAGTATAVPGSPKTSPDVPRTEPDRMYAPSHLGCAP
jgi:hypothetical protein